MRKLVAPLATAAAGLALVLVLAGAVGAQEADRCRASLEPARVAVQQGPVPVNATLSEPLEAVEDVAVQDGSGLEVRSVRAGGPTDVAIVLDVSGAEPGEWTLTIEGTDTDCEGVLSVTEGPIAVRTSD